MPTNTVHSGQTRRYDGLTLVADGDGYILGSRHSADFLAVPEIGGLVIQWLQSGAGESECTARAGELAGEPVDVAGFLADLESAGLLPGPLAGTDAGTDAGTGPETGTGVHAAAGADRPPRGHRVGKVLFGRIGLLVQGSLAALGVLILITRPELRPTFTDAIVTGVPLASILIMTVIGICGGLLHELAHLLAAAAKGVPSSLSLGRRLYTLVYQTDLTRLWSLPRRDRLLPLSAGMIIDAALLGALLGLLAGPLRTADPLLVDVVRAAAFIKFGGLIFQAEVFMRTDVYAILVAVSGCRNLWATKGAVARRAIGRAGAADLDHLDGVSGTEIRWARAYLALYLPGVVGATWYLVTFALPALGQIVAMSVAAVVDNGPLTLIGAAGVLATVLAVVPTGLVLLNAVRSGLRVMAGVLRRGPEPLATNP